MKKLKEILKESFTSLPLSDSDLELSLQESSSVQENETEGEEEADDISVAMANLSDIMAMSDDIYNTISGLDEVEESILSEIQGVTEHLAKVYADLGEAHGIVGSTYGLESEITMEELEEATTFVSKGIYTGEGKKIAGSRSSSLFLMGLRPDETLAELSWKEWSALSVPDTSSEAVKKRFIDTLASKIVQFNKKVDLNGWMKAGNRSFEDTVSYIFKLDPNVKYSKASGLKESEEIQEALSPSTVEYLGRIGMEQVRHPDRYAPESLADKKISSLYGIKMRAGAWADSFAGEFSEGPEPYFIADKDGVVKVFTSEDSFVSALEKLSGIKLKTMNEEVELEEGNSFGGSLFRSLGFVKMTDAEVKKAYYKWASKIKPGFMGWEQPTGKYAVGFVGNGRFFVVNKLDPSEIDFYTGEKAAVAAIKNLKEGFNIEEKLSSKNPIEDWIHDFIKSDAPQFEGKDKKERIKMAIAAFYAATGQTQESMSESNVGFEKNVPLDVYVYDFLERGNIAGPLVKIIRLAVGAYFGDQGRDSEVFKTTRGL